MTVEFELSCEISEFKKYYETIREQLTNLEITLIEQDPEQLIVWREEGTIVGHTLWHKASTDEHRPGSPRDGDDKALLRELFEGKKEIIELHEVWLKKEHRGKGYGNQFFDFFEKLMRSKQYTEIAYYAYQPAAISLCRKRGYKEACCLQHPGFEGTIEKTYVFRLSL